MKDSLSLPKIKSKIDPRSKEKNLVDKKMKLAARVSIDAINLL